MTVLLFSAPNLKPTAKWTFQGEMFSGGGSVYGGAWCPYIASIDPTNRTSVVLTMNNYVGRGIVAPPHYKFVPNPPAGAVPTWPLLDGGFAHVSAVFVGQEPKNRTSVVMRWLTGQPSCLNIPGTSTYAAAAAATTPPEIGSRRKDDLVSNGSCTQAHSDDTIVEWGWVGAHSLPITIGAAHPTAPVQNSQGLTYTVVSEVDALRIPGTYYKSINPHAHPAPPLAESGGRSRAGAEDGAEDSAEDGAEDGAEDDAGDGSVAALAPPAPPPPPTRWHSESNGVAVELQINITLPASQATVCNAGLAIRATPDGSER